MGDPLAIRKLTGPEPPDAVAYLLEWTDELARTRTVGPHGVDGFSYPMIESWARLTDRSPLPHEVDALLTLDAVMRFPEGDGSAGEDET